MREPWHIATTFLLVFAASAIQVPNVHSQGVVPDVLCLGHGSTEKPISYSTVVDPASGLKRGCDVCHDFETGAYEGGEGKNIRWIRTQIEFPKGSGNWHTVKYTKEKSEHPCSDATPCDGTLADGDDRNLDGPCEVCHENTRHHLNTGDSHSHNDGLKCTAERCHPHFGSEDTYWFRPNLGGAKQAHYVHFDRERGPKLGDSAACPTCHTAEQLLTQTNRCLHCHAPYSDATGPIKIFKDGNLLETTTVCNNCHSPEGPYDGVNDPVIGAKNNFRNSDISSNVYAGQNLKPGKEKWCVGCHDGDSNDPSSLPANSKQNGKGVFAPNVAGDGKKYGYWVSGHGRPSANKNCPECHDLSKTHIDSMARTYDVDEKVAFKALTVAQSAYVNGYRLRSGDAAHQLKVPRINQTDKVDTESFTLCANQACHRWNKLTSMPEQNTGFWSTDNSDNQKNLHAVHLTGFSFNERSVVWDSDDDGAASTYSLSGGDSMISCPTCHNPHGTRMFFNNGTYAANSVMVRDGSLDSLEKDKALRDGRNYRGLKFMWYTEGAGSEGSGEQTNKKSESMSGQLTTGAPSCTATCHTRTIYERNGSLLDSKKQAPQIATMTISTTDTRNVAKTVFSANDTMRVHVSFSIVGDPKSTYFVKPSRVASKLGISGKWWGMLMDQLGLRGLEPNAQINLAPGQYNDFFVWEVDLSNKPVASGNNIAQVMLKMWQRDGMGSTLSYNKVQKSFKILPSLTTDSIAGVSKNKPARKTKK